MGKHFDSLVDIVRRHITACKETADFHHIKHYYNGLISSSELIELPFSFKEMVPEAAKDFSRYVAYLQDYQELSQKYGSVILMPFNKTAVEDKDSVVIFDHQKDDCYIITMGRKVNSNNSEIVDIITGYARLGVYNDMLQIGNLILIMYHIITIDDQRKSSLFDLLGRPSFRKQSEFFEQKRIIPAETLEIMQLQGVRMEDNVECMFSAMLHDINQAVVTCLEQIAYVMDPTNVLIKRIPYTTAKPVYFSVSLNSLIGYFKGEKIDLRRAARDFWKVPISRKYASGFSQSNLREILSGDSVRLDHNHLYEVWIKESPTKITKL